MTTAPDNLFGITPEGFVRKKLLDIKASIDTGAKEVFGQDLNVSPQSVEGQMHGIFSGALSELWEMAEYLHNSFDPTQAFGDRLDKILALLNLPPRHAAVYSGTVLSFNGEPGVTVPTGTRVDDINSSINVFTDRALVLNEQGQGEVFARPATGPVIDILAGVLTVLATPLQGVSSVTNNNPDVIGILEVPEETDQQIRNRLLGTAGGVEISNAQNNLINLLRSIPGVVEAVVYVNEEGGTDSRGIPGKSYAVVIEGGDEKAIASTIWNNHTLGIGTFGTTTTNFSDAQGICRKIDFSRPKNSIALINMTVRYVDSRCGCQPDDLEGLKQNLLALLDNRDDCDGFGIGQPLIVSRLYSAFSEIQGLEIVSLEVAKKNFQFVYLCEGQEYEWDQAGYCDGHWPEQIIFSTDSIPVAWNEKPIFLEEGISLKVIDPFNNVVVEECVPVALEPKTTIKLVNNVVSRDE